MLNLKIILLVTSFIGSLLAYLLFNRILDLCTIYCGDAIGEYQNVLLFSPFVLFFSILTFKTESNLFLSWWSFSKIAIPTILLISFFINLGLHHTVGGFMNLSNVLDWPILVTLYSFYTIGSLIAIYIGHRKNQKRTV